MAVINPTINNVPTIDRAHIVTFTPMTFSGLDVGNPVEMAGSADRSVQITGTFGTGGSILVEGSNDGTNYVTLTDYQGTALTFTAAGLRSIQQIVRFIRPRVTAGDGTTSLTATFMMRRPTA